MGPLRLVQVSTEEDSTGEVSEGSTSVSLLEKTDESSKSFDFSIFERQLESIYKKNPTSFCWGPRHTAPIFGIYFECYKVITGRDHPRLANENVKRIIDNLPNAYDADNSKEFDLDPYEYDELIPMYFEQDWDDGVDYHINHFMAGNVRAKLYYTLEKKRDQIYDEEFTKENHEETMKWMANLGG